MAKARDYHIHGDVNKINRLKEEYEFIGKYHVSMPEPGHLIVHALPPAKPKKKKNDGRDSRENSETSSVRKGSPRGNRKQHDSSDH